MIRVSFKMPVKVGTWGRSDGPLKELKPFACTLPQVHWNVGAYLNK